MAGTDGGAGVTNGKNVGRGLDRRDRIALVGVVIATSIVAAVNAMTVADDFAGAGRPLDPWEPWVWELTSAAFWIAVALPVIRLSRPLRPPARPWPTAIGALLLGSIFVCAAHIGWLAASRAALYRLLGSAYAFDFSAQQFVYEWRKDLLSLALLAGIGFLIDRLTGDPAPAAAAPFRLEVRDGVRTVWLRADDIERVEAAGNYVELHTGAGSLLHRATLAAVAEALAPHGFVRIHRSRLVRRTAITAMTTTPSGDFEAQLTSGAIVTGSRRFRAAIAG